MEDFSHTQQTPPSMGFLDPHRDSPYDGILVLRSQLGSDGPGPN